jgi:hypothetical protein
MCALLLLLLITISSFLVLPVAGFGSGAGQCLIGEPSVGSPHLPSDSGNITLSGNGIEVSIDGTVLDPSTPFTVSAGEEHVVAVAAAGSTPFRGYLLVLSTVNEGIDLSAALVASDEATGQIATVCATPLIGVTHTSSDDKTTVTALLNVAEEAALFLDVTVVLQNGGGVSQYGYASYQVPTSFGGAAVTYVPKNRFIQCLASFIIRASFRSPHLTSPHPESTCD